MTICPFHPVSFHNCNLQEKKIGSIQNFTYNPFISSPYRFPSSFLTKKRDISTCRTPWQTNFLLYLFVLGMCSIYKHYTYTVNFVSFHFIYFLPTCYVQWQATMSPALRMRTLATNIYIARVGHEDKRGKVDGPSEHRIRNLVILNSIFTPNKRLLRKFRLCLVDFFFAFPRKISRNFSFSTIFFLFFLIYEANA